MHSIKGLEFGAVFIVGMNDRVLPYHPSKDPKSRLEEEVPERRLFYVGMTRATELPYLLSSGAPSSFLGDIDPDCLRIDRAAKYRRFYKVPVHGPLQGEAIKPVRARGVGAPWVLSELEKTYDYPLPASRSSTRSRSSRGRVSLTWPS